MTVDRDDGKQLAVSSILLCKRFRDAATAAKEAAQEEAAQEETAQKVTEETDQKVTAE